MNRIKIRKVLRELDPHTDSTGYITVKTLEELFPALCIPAKFWESFKHLFRRRAFEFIYRDARCRPIYHRFHYHATYDGNGAEN